MPVGVMPPALLAEEFSSDVYSSLDVLVRGLLKMPGSSSSYLQPRSRGFPFVIRRMTCKFASRANLPKVTSAVAVIGVSYTRVCSSVRDATDGALLD